MQFSPAYDGISQRGFREWLVKFYVLFLYKFVIYLFKFYVLGVYNALIQKFGFYDFFPSTLLRLLSQF